MRRSPLARPVPARTTSAVVAAVLVAGALAGCSALSLDGGCEIAPGDASTTISATGDVGSSPAVEFPTPLVVDAPEASVLAGGTGTEIATGSIVLADTVVFDAATGESLLDATIPIVADASGLALGEALDCATASSRVAVVGQAGDLSGNADLVAQLGEDTTVVAVIDVAQVVLGKANGVNQLPQDGMPTVVTAVDGQPGITSTYLTVPTEPRTSLIKAGGGAVVAEGDQVVFHARSFTWTAGSDSSVTVGGIDSWAATQPYVLEPSLDSMGDQTLVDALIGVKVGSQVLVVIPDADDATSATVYVFDVLGILSED